MNVTEDLPLASNDIDVQLLDSAKSGDLETVKVCTTCLHIYIICCTIFCIILEFPFFSSVHELFWVLFSGWYSTVLQCVRCAGVETCNSSWSCGELSWSWRPSFDAAAFCRWLQPQNSCWVSVEAWCWCACKGQRVWYVMYFCVLSFDSASNSFHWVFAWCRNLN